MLLVTAAFPYMCLPIPTNNFKITACKPPKCIATKIDHDQTAAFRRNANYSPTSWDYNFIKSLTSNYTEEKYGRQVDELREEVKHVIRAENDDSLAKLELLDSVQRLGLNHHFKKDVKQAVDVIYNNSADAWCGVDLHLTALRFRILREHGYTVPQDVFRRFRDETGYFKVNLRENVKGMLSLYEASFFGFEGEEIIDEAKAFATAQLKHVVKDKILFPADNITKVKHALDMPLRWRLPRAEAFWYVDTYEQDKNRNLDLLKLAKLDYNVVQSVHQEEVSKLASWWKDTGLGKMTFARDRLVEHYCWCNGMVCGAEYSAFRDMATKVLCVMTTIDDVYDVYGSLDELQLFTDFVQRWDITKINKLPMNIKTVLLAMFNTTNEIGYWTIKKRDFNIIPYLRKQWTNLCNAFLQEATWYHTGHKPTLEEYLKNGTISVAAPLMLFCAYFLTAETITMEALDYIDKLPSVMWCPSMILRLTNDLGTSSDELARGDTLKTVQCYMNDTGSSEEVSRIYVDKLVHETWKILNKDLLGSYPFGEPFLTANPNIARTAQTFYQSGDGLGTPDHQIKEHINSLLLEHFTLS